MIELIGIALGLGFFHHLIMEEEEEKKENMRNAVRDVLNERE